MKRRLMLASLAFITATAFVHADTLVLNDGRRLQGGLLGVYGRDIEFDRGQRDDYRNEATGVPPRGMRERQIVVDAREQWIDTEIDVSSGQQIYFTSTGETRWGRDRRDGAAGERNSPLHPNRPLPNRPAAALIGRIGDSNQIFFIGADGGPFRARDTGRLYLGINDDVLTDNSGNLRVTVSY